MLNQCALDVGIDFIQDLVWQPGYCCFHSKRHPLENVDQAQLFSLRMFLLSYLDAHRPRFAWGLGSS